MNTCYRWLVVYIIYIYMYIYKYVHIYIIYVYLLYNIHLYLSQRKQKNGSRPRRSGSAGHLHHAAVDPCVGLLDGAQIFGLTCHGKMEKSMGKPWGNSRMFYVRHDLFLAEHVWLKYCWCWLEFNMIVGISWGKPLENHRGNTHQIMVARHGMYITSKQADIYWI